MYKSAIVKSKSDTIVCLVSEMEKPKVTNKETLKELLKWQHSVKEYSIRNEDKEEFRKLAFESYCNKPKHNTIEQALSEGISIDPNLVEVKHIIMGNVPCGLNFATLKPTIKESLQSQLQAANERIKDFEKFCKWVIKAEWQLDNYRLKAIELIDPSKYGKCN